MTQYIEKEALVAQIDKWLANLPYIEGSEQRIVAYKNVKDFVNILEVKEVDLDKEIEKCLKQHSMLAVGKKDFTDIAKHFFEIGLKVVQNNS